MAVTLYVYSRGNRGRSGGGGGGGVVSVSSRGVLDHRTVLLEINTKLLQIYYEYITDAVRMHFPWYKNISVLFLTTTCDKKNTESRDRTGGCLYEQSSGAVV